MKILRRQFAQKQIMIYGQCHLYLQIIIMLMEDCLILFLTHHIHQQLYGQRKQTQFLLFEPN